MEVTAVLWICPRCGNYYGASSAGNLREEMNTDLHGRNQTFARSICPNCRRIGHEIHRVPIRVTVTLGEFSEGNRNQSISIRGSAPLT